MKPGFTGRLTITQLPTSSWRLWELHEPIEYDIGHNKSVIVPKGFVSDGPTIPRLLWNLLPIFGSYSRAGFLHDYLCARIAIGNPHPQVKTRKQADHVFLDAMKALNVGVITRTILYAGVLIGSVMGARSTTLDENYHLLTKEGRHGVSHKPTD